MRLNRGRGCRSTSSAGSRFQATFKIYASFKVTTRGCRHVFMYLASLRTFLDVTGYHCYPWTSNNICLQPSHNPLTGIDGLFCSVDATFSKYAMLTPLRVRHVTTHQAAHQAPNPNLLAARHSSYSALPCQLANSALHIH